MTLLNKEKLLETLTLLLVNDVQRGYASPVTRRALARVEAAAQTERETSRNRFEDVMGF